ncbi:MAG: PAS domain S-box protein [Lentisphaerae bacterium]|nr:PAS domain S-box protein [Lentisphaerota bacterium]
MASKRDFSRTMRIDLIPDVPTEPVDEKKERVVIATPSTPAGPAGEARTSAGDSRYEELLQSVYDAAVIAELDGTVVDANARAVEFFQYERNELCERSVFDLVSGADDELIAMLLENLQHERYALIQAYCVRRDGTYFPSEIAVNKLQLDEMHLCFFVRDVTLRRQSEEMLRTEHNAIQNSGNGIAVANIYAHMEYVNPAVARMWGYGDAEDMVGADVRDLLSEREEAEAMIAAVMQDHETWTTETKATTRNDEEFDVQISAACNRNSDGEPVGIVFSFVDISDRKRVEEIQRRSEQQRVMLESLGAACHHLGQPATVLLANLGVLRKRLEAADGRSTELVDNSIEAAKALGEILHKLNEVTKYETTTYLRGPEGSDLPENRILKI